MTARVSVREAAVRFDGEVAVDGVDLDVADGEVVAVLGPSGSGKSTLLRAIAGLQPLDAGRVLLDDIDQEGIPPHRRGVGLMFQDHALFPHRDVAGNVAFGLRMQRRPRPELAARVEELLALVDLPGFASRRVATLSGGEQQRVALARALAPRPRVLLLDEPLGALDRSLRDRLVVELRGLFTRLGLTVVAVTHDHHEAFALADRLVLVDRGRILQTGPPREVWDRPASRRAAELLGFGNLIDVPVEAGQAQTPWGPLPVEHPDGMVTLLLRASGVVLDPGGAVTGTVLAATFQGADTTVAVTVPGAPPLDAHVPTSAAPTPGSAVRLSIRPDAVVVLGPAAPPR